MASHARLEALDVLAPKHESLLESTTFSLSDIDQLIPCTYVQLFIVYQFSGSREELKQHLRRGLENVLTCLPMVGGELLCKEDGEDIGRLSIIRRNHKPVQLYLHYMDEGAAAARIGFPSYADMAARGFPPVIFQTYNVSLQPPGLEIGGICRNTGCPVSAFQANFIRGGVVMSVSIHHAMGDASTLGHTARLWAASTRAAATNGMAMPVFTPALDHSYFNCPAIQPSWEETQEKKKNLRWWSFKPIVKPDGNDAPSAPAETIAMPMIPTDFAMYRFEAKQVAALKKLCWPEKGCNGSSGPVTYVSSYDAVCGLAWRCMTRARIPFLQQVHKDADIRKIMTVFSHPTDARFRLDNVPESYFGNGICATTTDSIPIRELIEDGSGLSKAAQLIRDATQHFKKSTIPDLLTVRRGLAGREEMLWTWFPENVLSSSWTHMHAMEDFDFGFGKPASVRSPPPPYAGVIVVLPGSRLPGRDGEKEGTANGAFDVFVVLEKGCQDLLRADPEFRQYCTEIGK